MIGVYENVFRTGILDLTNIRAVGLISSTGRVEELTLSSIGILGHNYCYHDKHLLNSLANQIIGDNEENILDMRELDIVDQAKCKTGQFLFFTFDHEKVNEYVGLVQFKGLQDVLTSFIETAPDDHIQGILDALTFPKGLEVRDSYENSLELGPIELQGEMNFLGLTCYVDIKVDIHGHSLAMIAQAPSFKLGGGNLRFNGKLTDDAVQSLAQQVNFQSEIEQVHFSGTDRSNNLTSNLILNDLENAKLKFKGVAMIFGISQMIETDIKENELIFNIEGHPFNGQLKATI